MAACTLLGEGSTSYFVLLNEYGEVVDHLALDFIRARLSRAQVENDRDSVTRKKDDVRKFSAFVKLLSPQAVCCMSIFPHSKPHN